MAWLFAVLALAPVLNPRPCWMLAMLCCSCVQDFSSVAEKTGTYTAMDYADIMEHLIKRWNISDRSDLTGEVRRSRRCCGGRLAAPFDSSLA